MPESTTGLDRVSLPLHRSCSPQGTDGPRWDGTGRGRPHLPSWDTHAAAQILLCPLERRRVPGGAPGLPGPSIWGAGRGWGTATPGATRPQALGDFVSALSWLFLAGKSSFMSPFPPADSPPPMNITFLPDQIFSPGGSAEHCDTHDPRTQSSRSVGAWLCHSTGRRCPGTPGKAQHRRLHGGGKGLIRRSPGDALRRGMRGWGGVCAGHGAPRGWASNWCRDGSSWSRSVLILSHPNHRPSGAATDLGSARDRSCHRLIRADFGFTFLGHRQADNRTDSLDLGVSRTCPRNGVLQCSHRAPVPPAVTTCSQLRWSSRHCGAAGTPHRSSRDGSSTHHPKSRPQAAVPMQRPEHLPEARGTPRRGAAECAERGAGARTRSDNRICSQRRVAEAHAEPAPRTCTEPSVNLLSFKSFSSQNVNSVLKTRHLESALSPRVIPAAGLPGRAN